MNTLTKTLTTIALTVSTIGMANASSTYVAADDYVTSKICTFAVQGDRMELHKAIKDSRLSKKFIAENVTCNDQNIVAFVQENAENPARINNVLTGGKFKTKVKVTDLAVVEY